MIASGPALARPSERFAAAPMARKVGVCVDAASVGRAGLPDFKWQALPKQGNADAMRFQPGQSGNPAGSRKGARSLAARIRAMAEKDAVEIIGAVVEGAKLGDVECRRLFLKYIYPLPRVIATPVDLPLAQSAAEAQEQIAQLTVMAARGDFDIEALPVLTRSLTLAIYTRLSQLEEIIETREGEAEAADAA
jgi:hypothetical protein